MKMMKMRMNVIGCLNASQLSKVRNICEMASKWHTSWSRDHVIHALLHGAINHLKLCTEYEFEIRMLHEMNSRVTKTIAEAASRGLTAASERQADHGDTGKKAQSEYLSE
jgi:hypothetical protein